MTPLLAAIAIGLVHTLVGPDHYLPFVAIGRARRWALGRTLLLTAGCGLGHVLSSVAVGLVGVAAGSALAGVQAFEGARGQLGGLALLVFGAGYFAWGLWLARRDQPHAHPHLHSNGTLHSHSHQHAEALLHGRRHEHTHQPATLDGSAQITGEPELAPGAAAAASPASWRSLTPWVLFVIFVLGPCEPLVPLFFAAALGGAWLEVGGVVLGYALATVVAMLALVAVLWVGLSPLPLRRLERFGHAAAGMVVMLTGAAVTMGL